MIAERHDKTATATLAVSGTSMREDGWPLRANWKPTFRDEVAFLVIPLENHQLPMILNCINTHYFRDLSMESEDTARGFLAYPRPGYMENIINQRSCIQEYKK